MRLTWTPSVLLSCPAEGGPSRRSLDVSGTPMWALKAPQMDSPRAQPRDPRYGRHESRMRTRGLAPTLRDPARPASIELRLLICERGLVFTWRRRTLPVEL